MSDVYIAGSLRHAPKEWWKIYEDIAHVVKKFGLKAHLPHIDTLGELNQSAEDLHNPNLSLPIRAEAYKRNFEAIKISKIVIAEVTRPSTGTGVEIGFALQLHKPIICLAHKDVDITSMVLGPVHLGLIKIIRYENEDDGLMKLEDVLESLDFRKI